MHEYYYHLHVHVEPRVRGLHPVDLARRHLEHVLLYELQVQPDPHELRALVYYQALTEESQLEIVHQKERVCYLQLELLTSVVAGQLVGVFGLVLIRVAQNVNPGSASAEHVDLGRRSHLDTRYFGPLLDRKILLEVHIESQCLFEVIDIPPLALDCNALHKENSTFPSWVRISP